MWTSNMAHEQHVDDKLTSRAHGSLSEYSESKIYSGSYVEYMEMEVCPPVAKTCQIEGA